MLSQHDPSPCAPCSLMHFAELRFLAHNSTSFTWKDQSQGENKHKAQERKQAVVAPRLRLPGYSLFSFGSVTEEEEGCGQEEHPSQDDDKRAEHESVAQAEELPDRGLLRALPNQV